VAEGRVGLAWVIERRQVAVRQDPPTRLSRVSTSLVRRHQQIRASLDARYRNGVARLAGSRLGLVAVSLHRAFGVTRERIRALVQISQLLLALLLHVLNPDRKAHDVARPSPTGSRKVTASNLRRRRRHPAVVLALAMLALGLALLMPERELTPLASETQFGALSGGAQGLESATADALSLSPAAPKAVLPLEPRPWRPVRQPIALFHLDSLEVSDLASTYRVSQREQARQDTLIWQMQGESADREARRSAALLVVERHEGAMPTEKPLFADLAMRAAEHRLVLERMASPLDIRSKFGPMEAAEVTFRQETGLLSCLAFRRVDMAGITLVGWLCGTPQRPVDRVSASCFLDRLDLVAGGRDATLRIYFAEAERARQNCPSSRQPGRRATWMDHDTPIPSLKLSARR
jgi:hypothetical protein